MSELFDYIAGSETGAIIGATLLLKNDDPETLAKGQQNKYFADKTIDWFEENIETLYRDSQMPRAVQMFLVLFLTGGCAILVYKLVEKHYSTPDYDDKTTRL